MNRNWSDQDIESRAPAVATAIQQAAARARNEAELRLHVNPLLVEFAREIELNLDDQHEKLIGRGRADSVYGRVIIEYEAPRSLSDRNTAAKNKHAIEQVKQYAGELSRQEPLDSGRFLGVVLDGSWIIFLRRRKEDWEVSPPRPVDAESIADLLLRLRSLRGKALLPEPLVRDFGGVEARGRFTASDTAARCVSAFYHALAASDSPKVDALFSQWRLLFSEVCGYGFDSPKLDLAQLAASYGVTLAPLPKSRGRKTKPDPAAARQAERLFFALHTYYATLITLLAAEIVTYYMSRDYMPSYLGKLESLQASPLRRELADLHSTGGLFGQVGVQNFLEGDFFAWYLEAWTPDLAAALQSLVRGLRDYDPATFQVEPDETRDLLKKLYQYLLPKKLRHDLGEYYTPDWLAELVLNEVGYDGDLSKRILDPACGSGTFLALEIKRAKDWAREKMVHGRETLDAIRHGIVGFDLNPLAVIAARTNYLIALGDLLRYRSGDIEIPVYLCDAILTPTERRQLDLRGRQFPLETAVGTFEVPLALGTQPRIAALTRLLESALRGSLPTAEFLARAEAELGLDSGEFTDSQECLRVLYDKLRELSEQNRNGIWARIIKNFFAPVFQVSARKFDYVAGNPPWINWESLPEGYRKNTARLWADYGMAPKAKSSQFELGTIKRDLSALFVYVSADKYLSDTGKLGFLVTESLFTSGAAAGFRRFSLPALPGQYPTGLQVLGVHNLVELMPFEGASNRTALLCLSKGTPTQLPIRYVKWRKTPGKRLDEGATLATATKTTRRERNVARPITGKPGAPWISGPATALHAADKVIGKSHYKAWAGTCTWLNGVYWVRILEHLPDGKVLVENLTEAGKTDLPQVRAAIEPGLMYPLLRGREIRPWHAYGDSHIILPHTHETGWEAVSESQMRLVYPSTLAYLRQFREQLLRRSGYRQLREGHPFYILGNVGVHTFADHKVVWRRMIPVPAPAVVSKRESDTHAPVSTEVSTFVTFREPREAHYFCALASSSPCGFVSASYSTGKSFGAPHVLDHVAIPRFDRDATLHLHLSDLSLAAHEAASRDDRKRLREIEQQVDEAAAELWGLTPKELQVIQKTLASRRRTADADEPE